MEKVRCIQCGSTGYTASPEAVKCGICGSGEEVVEMDEVCCRSDKAPVTAYLRRLLHKRYFVSSWEEMSIINGGVK